MKRLRPLKPDERVKVEKVLDLAKSVDPGDPAARMRFILSCIGGDLWVRGKTNERVAKVWGLSEYTVEQDASKAALAYRVTSSRDELGKFATQTTHAMVEGRVTLAAGLAKRLEDELEAKAKPSHLRDVASALGSVEASLSRSLEWLGKVGGLTNEAPMVQVNIEGQPTKVPAERLASMPTQLFEMLERVVDAHPEHEAVLPLLAAEMRRSLGVGDAVVVVDKGSKKLR